MSGRSSKLEPNIIDRSKIDINPGRMVVYQSVAYRITELLDYNSVLAVNLETGRSASLPIKQLKAAPQSISESKYYEFEEINENDKKEAQRRYQMIKPLFDIGDFCRKDVEELAQRIGASVTTLYRWVNQYKGSRSISSLIPKRRGWKKELSRLSPEVDNILKRVIEEVYLTPQRLKVSKIIREVNVQCAKAGLKIPHPNSVRYRVKQISERDTLRHRGQKEKASNKFEPAAGKFPNANYPLAVVQIDHTEVDLIIVDEYNRKPIGRPYLTLAIDVFSRCVVGMYLSLDAPSAVSVGMCVAHAMCSKEAWLEARGIDTDWPMCGIMDKIHVDNGSDFRSETFRLSCIEYNIDLEFRPVKRPKYGGHIERLMGTCMNEVHDIPGTTFSSIKERGEYKSDKMAVMTLNELERWLSIYITQVYHASIHSGIGARPIKKWETGVFGNADTDGHGLPSVPASIGTVLRDFLPIYRRTIQTYGVAIDGLRYYDDIMRKWINAKDPNDPKKKRKFIFRRDTRDISVVWFFDPDSKSYFRIPFANQSLPPMSIWEYRDIKKWAKEEGKDPKLDSIILQGVQKMRDMIDESHAATKKARRKKQKRTEHDLARARSSLKLKKPASSSSDALLGIDWDAPEDAYEDIA